MLGMNENASTRDSYAYKSTNRFNGPKIYTFINGRLEFALQK